MTEEIQKFGGDWTNEKLDRIRKYLNSYTTALKNQPFKLIYIDAFAGTGYRNLKSAHKQQISIFPDESEKDAEAFHAGSARIALETNPPFAAYYFIEQDPDKCAELERLKDEFPDKAKDIHIENEEANAFISRICDEPWKRMYWRGVLP